MSDRECTSYPCPNCPDKPFASHERWCSECGYDTHLKVSQGDVQNRISELEAKLASTQRALDASRSQVLRGPSEQAPDKHRFGEWEVRYRHLRVDGEACSQPQTMVVETDNPWHAVAMVKDHLHGTQELYAFDDVKRRES